MAKTLFFFLRKVKKGTLLIDSSTIDPSVSKEMALAAEKMGAVFMDAPVSGGKGRVWDVNILLLWRSRTVSLLAMSKESFYFSCFWPTGGSVSG